MSMCVCVRVGCMLCMLCHRFGSQKELGKLMLSPLPCGSQELSPGCQACIFFGLTGWSVIHRFMCVFETGSLTVAQHVV